MIGRSRGELDRFTARDPVRHGRCEFSQRVSSSVTNHWLIQLLGTGERPP